jgi:hypothetical protein
MVDCNREFHNTKTGTKVPSGLRNRINQLAAQLVCHLGKLAFFN